MATWIELAATYRAAKAAEDAYDLEHISISDDLPVGPERNAACDAIPARIWDQSTWLQDARLDAEEALMASPSPDPAAFALKVIICRGEGRNLDGYDDLLLSEARGIIDQTQGGEA